MKKNEKQLAQVFEQTVEEILYGCYDMNPKLANFDEDNIQMVYNSEYITSIGKQKKERLFDKPAKITVENKDSFQKAQEMGEDCLVLDMANDRVAGGNPEKGAKAQEEELCRRSTLSLGLYQFSPKKFHTYFTNETIAPLGSYPLSLFGAIYVPGVTVYKEKDTYAIMKNPFKCAVIAIGAIRLPILKKGRLNNLDVSITKGKIRTILRVAIKHNHTKLVLGAFGCGAFGNPPRQMAELFKKVLAEKEFYGFFSEICFAIIEDDNSTKCNKEGNYKPFKEVFGC